MAGSRGSIRTNSLCSAASQSALTPPLFPPVGHPLSPPGSSLIKPEELVTQGFGLTGDVPYLEKIHHPLAGRGWLQCKIQCRPSYLFMYGGFLLLNSVILYQIFCQ